jgi:hypothetical protein
VTRRLPDLHFSPWNIGFKQYEFPEFHHPLLVTGGTKMTALAGKGKKILVVAVFIFHPGKAIVQIAAIKITVNDLLEIGTEESVGPLKPFLIDLDKGFQMIFNTAIINYPAASSGVLDVIPCLTRNPVSFPGFPLSRE